MITDNELVQLCADSYHHATFSVGDCEAIIKYYDDCQVIAFRGTEMDGFFKKLGFIDVIRDMRMIPWYSKTLGWCHAGFLKGGRASAEYLDNKLDKSLPTYVTGHSMGAAVGLTCAATLVDMGYDVVKWVGVAGPKAQLFRNTFKGFQQVNYRYRGDIVPLMPRFTPYRHNYPVIQLREDNKRKATWDDHDIHWYLQYVL